MVLHNKYSDIKLNEKFLLIYCISTYKRFTIGTQTRISVASQKFIMVVIYYLGGVNGNSDMKMGQSNFCTI